MTKIKICGCQTPADIQHAAACDVDYVGMVLVPGTIRFVPPNQRPDLVKTARDCNVTLVAVLRNNPKPSTSDESRSWYPGPRTSSENRFEMHFIDVQIWYT